MDASPTIKPRLERQGDSMPRLNGPSSRYDDMSSKRSGLGAALN